MSAQIVNVIEAGAASVVNGNSSIIVLMQKPEIFNTMISKVWPSLEVFIEKLLLDDITKTIAQKIEGFAFEKLNFGAEPPVLSNLKLYDSPNIEADEIVIDADIVYAGSMVVSATWKKITFGIRRVRLSGMLRFRIAPLRPAPPFFNCISVSMLGVPTVDFDSTGFANIVDFKPIYQALQSFISEKMLSLLVIPNAVIVPLSRKSSNGEQGEVEDFALTEFRCRIPRGVLQVLAVEASDLASHDLLSKSDPFVRVRIGADEKRSRTIENSSAPRWYETLEFDIRESAGALLSVELYDEDTASAADLIGRVTTLDFRDAIARVEDGAILSDLVVVGVESKTQSQSQSKANVSRFDTKWYQLSDTKDGRGRVRLGFRYFDFVENPAMLRTGGRPVSTVLCVYVHSASLTGDAKVTTNVTMQLRPASEQGAKAQPGYSTVFRQDTNEPRWDSYFKWLFPATLTAADCDNLEQTISFTVRTSTGNTVGEASVSLGDVLRSQRLRIENRSYELTPRNSGSLRVSLAVRYVATYDTIDFSKLTCAASSETTAPLNPPANVEADDGVGEYRIGRVRLSFSFDDESRTANVTVLKCSNLVPREGQANVRSCIVVRFLPSGRQKRRSSSFVGQNPVVNELFSFDVAPNEIADGFFCVSVHYVAVGLKLPFRSFCVRANDLLGEIRHVSITEIRNAMLRNVPSLTDWFDLTPIACDSRRA